jgi:hypothetical protein
MRSPLSPRALLTSALAAWLVAIALLSYGCSLVTLSVIEACTHNHYLNASPT